MIIVVVLEDESLSGWISAPSASQAVRTRSQTLGGNKKSVTACQNFPVSMAGESRFG